MHRLNQMEWLTPILPADRSFEGSPSSSPCGSKNHTQLNFFFFFLNETRQVRLPGIFITIHPLLSSRSTPSPATLDPV